MKHLRTAAGFLGEAVTTGFTLYQGYQIIQELQKKHREKKYERWMNEFTTIEIRSDETPSYFSAAKSWFYTHEKVSQIMPATIVPSASNRAITPLPVRPHPVHFEDYEIYFHWEAKTKDQHQEKVIISLRARDRETVIKVMRAIFDHHENRKPHVNCNIYRNKKSGWQEEGRLKADWKDVVIPPILPDNLYEEISKEIRWFLSNRAWYQKRGIPYHRSYILEGLPGSGKTSLVRCLAQEHGLDLHLPNLKQTSETEFTSAVSGLRLYDILFMEDIDCAGSTTTRRLTDDDGDDMGKEETFQPITLSGMLNALDGVGTPDGLITFSTTNHIEKLDPAFLRPGRTDRIIKFTWANQDQIEKLCHRFEIPEDQISELSKKWAEEQISMAAVQERLIEKCLSSLQIE